MPITTPKEMFARAYKEGYAIGAFNVNNMEIIQGIMQAGAEERSPLILQVSRRRPQVCRSGVHHETGGSRPLPNPISRWWCISITAPTLNCARPASTAASAPS